MKSNFLIFAFIVFCIYGQYSEDDFIENSRVRRDLQDLADIKNYTLPKLPYTLSALAPIISQQTLEFHYLKHHIFYFNHSYQSLVGPEMFGSGNRMLFQTGN